VFAIKIPCEVSGSSYKHHICTIAGVSSIMSCIVFQCWMYSLCLYSTLHCRVDDSIGKFVGFASQLHLLVSAYEASADAQFLEDFVAG
jgi:hypothetical protein